MTHEQDQSREILELEDKIARLERELANIVSLVQELWLIATVSMTIGVQIALRS